MPVFPRARATDGTAAPPIAPFVQAWSRPLRGANGRVEVWLVAAGSHHHLDRHARVLGSEDWSAIARIKNAKARDHARATRIGLSLALSHAVGGAVQPGAWRLQTNSYGKPRVVPGLPDVEFCMSHTDTMSVIAVSRECPVGIDIEAIGPNCDSKLLEAFCSARERRVLSNLSGIERQRAFARLWTLKEAYAKLTGTGLATDFRYLEFKIDPRWQAEGHQVLHRPGEARFESWLTEAPGGLCQVSVAVGEGASIEEAGEFVCFAVAADGSHHAATRSLEPGQGKQSNLALS